MSNTSVAKRHWNDSAECGASILRLPQPPTAAYGLLMLLQLHLQIRICGIERVEECGWRGVNSSSIRCYFRTKCKNKCDETMKPTTANVQRQQQRQRSKKCSSQTNHSTGIGIRFLPPTSPASIHPLSRTGSKNVPTEDANFCCCCFCYCDVAAAVMLLLLPLLMLLHLHLRRSRKQESSSKCQSHSSLHSRPV